MGDARAHRRRHPLPDLHEANPEIAAGLRIVERALGEPLRQIALNAAEEAPVVLEHVQTGEGSDGFNANSRQYGDLIAMGVIDPAMVTRLALQNASSIASPLLTTDCRIASVSPPANNAARAPAMSPEF